MILDIGNPKLLQVLMPPDRTSLSSALRTRTDLAGVQDGCCFPKGRVTSLVPKHRGGARLLLSPSRGAALTLHATSIFSLLAQAYRYQTADAFLSLPAAVATLLSGTRKDFSCALLSHSIGLPYPGCGPQSNSHVK